MGVYSNNDKAPLTKEAKNGTKKDFIQHPVGFDWLPKNERQEKPRTIGLTEIRSAYYSNFGMSYFKDLLEMSGNYIDSIKFAGGCFTLMNPDKIKEMIDLAHSYGVMVSTGGFMEYVLTTGKDNVKKYIRDVKNLGFDIVELSTGFITIPTSDWQRLIEEVQKAGMKAKPEIGVQYGAGGDSTTEELQEIGIQDIDHAVTQAKQFVDAGAYLIMMESEGVTENANPWRVDIPAKFINGVGLEKMMFEASDPQVFKWYVKNYGPEVNLFVDHSQLIQLESTRRGIWGTNDIWGRVLTYKG